MLSRCNKIKVLTLEARFISIDSLKMIRQYLNLALEELTLGYCGGFSTKFYGFLELNDLGELKSMYDFGELKSMSRLKILNLYVRKGFKDHKEEIQNLRKHLPHQMIRTFYEGCFYSLENGAYLWGIQQLRGPNFT